MKLGPNDINDLENKTKSEDKSDKLMSTEKDESGYEESPENKNNYNPNWTLRKSCSKLLDKLSSIYGQQMFEIIKPLLENDMQHTDWTTKERSILALGAVGKGCYDYLKPYLSTLTPFLIRELQHPNKFVRAISCWTLSRFSKFILIDNLSDKSYELFKEYLCEILKKFLDVEIIVQEAACTAFSYMVYIKKEKLEPYLFDIFKIITNVFDKYKGTSLLTLFDIISLLTENFEEDFKNKALINDLVSCVVGRWYSMIQNGDLKNISPIFDMICSFIRVSGSTIGPFFEYFMIGSLTIIESNLNAFKLNNNDFSFLDRELISKCLDMISVLCQNLPELLREHPNKNKVVDFIFKILDVNDSYLKHYVIALISDVVKVEPTLFSTKFDKLMNILLIHLEIPISNNKNEQVMEMDKLSVTNNSCWTIGLLANFFPDKIKSYIQTIIKKLLKILSLPKVNKTNLILVK